MFEKLESVSDPISFGDHLPNLKSVRELWKRWRFDWLRLEQRAYACAKDPKSSDSDVKRAHHKGIKPSRYVELVWVAHGQVSQDVDHERLWKRWDRMSCFLEQVKFGQDVIVLIL